MINQQKVQSVLENPRWASRTIEGRDSPIKAHLVTFPGVVGGDLRIQITGLTADYFGHTDVSVTCIGFDSDYVFGETGSHSYDFNFQENESLFIEDFSFEVSFRIPFEAQATEEGSTWNLKIDFANGVSEVFEIPVCRTADSDTEMTSVQIAANGPVEKKHQQISSSQNAINNRIKPYTMIKSNSELNFRFPARTPGRKTVLVQGLGIFAGLWAAMIVSVFWFSKEPPLGFIIVFGGMLVVMLMIIVFLLFGVSHCKITKEKITTKHTLFGLPINWTKANRGDVAGFSIKSLGLTSGQIKSQSNYLVLAVLKNESEKKQDLYRFLCVTAFDQYQARLLAKELNDYWGIGK